MGRAVSEPMMKRIRDIRQLRATIREVVAQKCFPDDEEGSQWVRSLGGAALLEVDDLTDALIEALT